ncbi:hypothetical protein OEZ86_001473 [Tetradesmus obliquus]|nr:hypothetical protein OEZ86_001473 [Tetradesmus obliquus]
MDKNTSITNSSLPSASGTSAGAAANAAAPPAAASNQQHALPAGLTPQALNTADKFDGKGDAHAWVENFLDLSSLYGWSEETLLKVARLKMKGPASRWARNRQFTDWDDFSSQFLRRFGETKETAICRFESCYQLQDESPTEFADRFLQDAERAGRVEDDALVYMFIKRLRLDLCEEAGRMRMRSIDEVVSFCNYWLGFRASFNADMPVKSVRFSDEPYPVGGTISGSRAVNSSSSNNSYAAGVRSNSHQLENKGAGQRPSPYRPPFRDHNRAAFRDNNRQPFRDVSNRPAAASHPSPAASKPAAVAAASSCSSAIDDLTRRFEKLEINTSQQLRDKEKEIRHLRHALQQQTQATAAAMPQINLFGYTADSGYEDEIDEQYLGEVMASIYAKHPRDESDPFTLRVPHKRVAVNPHANSPFVPSRQPPEPPRGPTRMQGVTSTSAAAATATAATAVGDGGTSAANKFGSSSAYDASRRMPRQRTPVDARPYGAAPRTTTTATAAAPARAANASAPEASSCFDAAKLADDKGKEMASVICKSIKLDGIRESTVVPQAVLTCLAGHLVGDKKMVDQGRDMARQVDSLIRSLHTSSRRPGAGLLLNMAQTGPMRTAAAQPSASLLRHGLLSRGVRPAGQRVSTCKVAAALNGQELTAVVDTGATTSAVTLDCLRRCNLEHLNAKDMGVSYINADGRISAGKGRVFNMALGLGAFETLISPTVTEALNYDLLIGNDVLSRARAVIDYDRLKMLLRIDQDTVQELDITLASNEASAATLYWDEMLTAAAPDCTADDDCDCQACEAGWQPDPVFSDLFFDYIFTVFSLPPCGPDAPGWKRCVPSNANQADSLLYEQWMDKRLSRMHELEELLIPKYIPATEARLSLLAEWQEAAFEDIKNGLIATEQILTADSGSCSSPDTNSHYDDSSSSDDWVDAVFSRSMYSSVRPVPVQPGTQQHAPDAAVTAAERCVTPLAPLSTRHYLEQLDEQEAPAPPSRSVVSRVEPVSTWPGQQPEITNGQWQSESNNESEDEDEVCDDEGQLLPQAQHFPPESYDNQQPGELYYSSSPLPAPYQPTVSHARSTARYGGTRLPPAFYGSDHDYPYPPSSHNQQRQVADREAMPPPPPKRSRYTLESLPPATTPSYVSVQASQPSPSASSSRHEALLALSEPYAGLDPISQQLLASFDLGVALPEPLGDMEEPDQILLFEGDAADDCDSWSDCPPLDSDSDSMCSDDCPSLEDLTSPVYMYTGSTLSDYEPIAGEEPEALLLHTSGHGTAPVSPDPPVYLPITEKAGQAQNTSVLLVPEDDPCAFPDDDMLSDNPTSFASMLDGSNLSKEESERALGMLQRNADVFCFKPSDLGLCTVDFHEIDTGDAPPVKQGFYRMPHQKYLQLKEHITRLLELGIIRESNSPWASPVHLVPKPNGETRMVVDSRRVNAITRKDAYPMPLIDDIVFQLGPCKYLATMDAYCGFNQPAS